MADASRPARPEAAAAIVEKAAASTLPTPMKGSFGTHISLQKGTIIGERFELLEVLGRGGMGVVWRARQLSLNAVCAVKLIAVAGSAEDLRTRFRREAQVTARIRSPHVVQVLDYGVWQNHAFIAMELLDGETLRERLDRCGTLAVQEVTQIVTQLSHALGRAHKANIVHRDLKPDNIFLAEGSSGDHIKVFDFGVARDRATGNQHPTLTASGALLGTPMYMSPEQLDGLSTLDHRADLWSMAVIVYECLVGKRPFDSLKFSALVHQIVAAPMPIPSQQAELPAAFDTWFSQAAARNVNDRFATASAMANALTNALDPSLSSTSTEAASASTFAASKGKPLPSTRLWAMAGAGTLVVLLLGWFLFSRGSGAVDAPVASASTTALPTTSAAATSKSPPRNALVIATATTTAAAPLKGKLPSAPRSKAPATPSTTATASAPLEIDHGF